MRSLPILLLVLVLAGGVAPACAEEPVWSFRAASWEPPPFALRFALRPSERRGDYRWVGTAVAGTGLGIAAAITAAAACGNSEHGPRDCTGITIGVGLLGAAVGGTIGHFIGRAIPRD
ncbi:MAG TPA: hypothetical protein VHR41_19450 [Gemmatimonadales bacterium]|jgi:hypothetical protein|nr:hypothetical protein [Gemmatimonadales bacterium]